MWFGSSLVECRDGFPEAVGSKPGRARYFITTCCRWMERWIDQGWIKGWMAGWIIRSTIGSLKKGGLD